MTNMHYGPAGYGETERRREDIEGDVITAGNLLMDIQAEASEIDAVSNAFGAHEGTSPMVLAQCLAILGAVRSEVLYQQGYSKWDGDTCGKGLKAISGILAGSK